MLFENIIEQINEYFRSIVSHVQESSTFDSLKDKFNSLSPFIQKLLITTICFLIILLTLATPIIKYQASLENMVFFEEQKKLTQKIISFQKKSKSMPSTPKEYKLADFKTKVNTLENAYSINFLPNQMSVSPSKTRSKIIRSANQNNFNVETKKTNIDQFLALTYSVQKLNKSLLIESIELKANSENPSYFDGSITVANLFVKPASDILPSPKVKKSKKPRSRRGQK